MEKKGLIEGIRSVSRGRNWAANWKRSLLMVRLFNIRKLQTHYS